MNRLELILELLKVSNSKNEWVQLAKGKYKKPNTISEVIKHTRDGKRNGN